MAKKKIQAIQGIENVPKDFVEPTRPVKLAVINRIECEKPEEKEDTRAVLIGRGLVALLEDTNVKGEYLVIGNSCSCNGFTGGWEDVPKNKRKIVLAPELLKPLVFSERSGIGRYLGEVDQVSEIEWQDYEKIKTGYPELIKIQEINELGDKVIPKFTERHQMDGALFINFVGMARVLDETTRNAETGRKMSESEVMETLLHKLSNPAINEYPLSGRLFVECLDYKGRLEASEMAVRILYNFLKTSKFKDPEKLKSAVEQLTSQIFERITHYSQKMRSLDLERIYGKLGGKSK